MQTAHLEAAVIDAEHEHRLGGVGGEARDRARLLAEGAGLEAKVDRAGSGVPHADGAVLRGSEDGAAVVDKCAVRDVGRVRAEDLHHVALGQLPHPCGRIL